MLLIFFPCLTAVARIANTMLNISDDCRYLVLVPDFRGKTFIIEHINCGFVICGLLLEVFSFYTRGSQPS